MIWQLGVRLAYIQVGGKADGAADAAPSAARCARGRRSQAHTPTDKRNKTGRKRGGAEPSPLIRLGIGCRFSAAHGFLSSDFALPFVAVMGVFFRYVTFGSLAITSGLTVPRYSPSSQQLNLSERINFFSFSP